MTKTALIIIDVQNDFLPNGALAVKEGDKILPHLNELLRLPFDFIIATQDWHPADHSSFAANHNKRPGEKIIIEEIEQILWPVHCVQHTHGAELSPKLESKKISKVFFKGTDKTIDSYSAFFDNGHRKSTGLGDFLHEHGVKEIYLAGLAADYCVLYSALDALQLGFKTWVITDACRGINIHPHDTEKAFAKIKQSGGLLTTAENVIAKVS